MEVLHLTVWLKSAVSRYCDLISYNLNIRLIMPFCVSVAINPSWGEKLK